MTFANEGVLVLIASPGDTTDERAAAAFELNRWNAARAQREAVTLIPWLYERNAVPLMGGHPQSIINSQAVDRADVVVAIFDTRLGTKTAEAVSGTAEEIERAIAAGKRVHVYFSAEDIKRDHFDPEQFAALEDFRKSLEPRGLLGRYASPEDLASQVRDALEFDIQDMGWGNREAPGSSSRTGAQLVARHDHRKEQAGFDKRGKAKYRTTSNRLVVQNLSTSTTASGVMVDVQGLNDLVMRFDGPSAPFDLTPGSSRSFVLIPMSRGDVEVRFTWTEGSEQKTSTVTIPVPGA